MPAKLTTKEFIKRARKVHGNKYDYSKVNYVHCNKEIKIYCQKCKEYFFQKPCNHLSGSGCQACGFRKIVRNKISTTKKFIKKSREIHGHLFNYNWVNYKKWSKKVKILCKKHNKFFLQSPPSHLAGENGCKLCLKEKLGKTLRWDINTFVKKAIKKHKDKYDYSKVVYKNCDKKVKIKCPIHGWFKQTPYIHLRSCGCFKCRNEQIGNQNRKLMSTFIKVANKIYNNQYDYSLSKYKNNRTPIKMLCKKHGLFNQTPGYHLSGRGCPKCQTEKTGRIYKFSQKDFIEKSKIVHKNKYDYSLVKFNNVRTMVKILCKKHGVFKQYPNSHLRGNGCPLCCTYPISKKETKWLDDMKIPNDNLHRQVYIKTKNKGFKIDGYIPETKEVYEFLGDYYHGNPDIFKPEKYNKTCYKTFGELYQKTIEKIKTLESNGYIVHYIWENDFNKQLKLSNRNKLATS